MEAPAMTTATTVAAKTSTRRAFRNCQVHGLTAATLVERISKDGRKEFASRCIECQRDATRRNRLSRTSHPNTAPGSYFNGLRTLHGEDINKRQVPFLENSWTWLKDPANQEKFNSTASLLMNKVLEIGISRLDPSFQPKLEEDN